MPKITKIETDNAKTRILILCHDPVRTLGLSWVARKILEGLLLTYKYEFHIVAIGYKGDPPLTPDEFAFRQYPFFFYPAQRTDVDEDRMGRKRFMALLAADAWDIVFTLFDPQWLTSIVPAIEAARKNTQRGFKWISYCAVDAVPDKEWITECVAKMDVPVLYTQYGYNEVMKHGNEELKKKLVIIPHGADTKIFHPLNPEERIKRRKELFRKNADKFIIVNVSRNQLRKNLPGTLRIFKKFRKLVPNSWLYLHTQLKDLGGNLIAQARQEGLEPTVDFDIPNPTLFKQDMGIPNEAMNIVYNAADVVINTGFGEGWGLPITQAMAAKTSVIAPDHSSLTEMLAGERGLLVKAGSSDTEWINLGIVDKDRKRPIPNVDDFVEKLYSLYKLPELRNKIVNNAYEWVQTIAWPKIQQQWVDLFQDAVLEVKAEREKINQIKKLGRNDECPICGEGIKIKKCRHAKYLQ